MTRLILQQGIRQIIAGRRKFFEHVYTKSEISKHRIYKVTITRFESGGVRFAHGLPLRRHQADGADPAVSPPRTLA